MTDIDIENIKKIKKNHSDALVLLRVDDWYEAYGTDAKNVSEATDLKYDRKSKICRFHHGKLDRYLPKLIRSGYRIAICERIEQVK
jgi:DNA mismatch repair protein MutS